MNTPGIYIKETLSQPASVAAVSTAVPAFIGYTELPATGPVRIGGMLDYRTHFGGGYHPDFSVNLNAQGEVQSLSPDFRYYLYDSLELYFRNGGGPCWILSAGTYGAHTDVRQEIEDTFALLDNLEEATLVVIPDLLAEKDNGSGGKESLLSAAQYSSVGNALLMKLGTLQDKFALLDLHGVTGDPFADASAFRNQINNSADLKYGAAYYPRLKSASTPSVPFTSLTLNQNYAGQPLVDQMNQSLVDVQAIETAFGFVPSAANCRAEYESKKAALEALLPAGTATAKKGALADIFRYLYDLVVGLDGLVGAAPTVAGELAGLKGDERLLANVQALYRFKGILEAHSTPLLLATTGFNAPSSTDWYNFDSSSYAAVVDVETDAALLADYETLVNGTGTTYTTWASATQILADLESGNYVDLGLLFAAVGSIQGAAAHKLAQAEQQLMSDHPAYAAAKAAVQDYLRLMPATAAVSGACCTNDRNYGVWRSPANLSLQGVTGPEFALSNAQQDGLNVDNANGKSINAIRNFTGKGTLIWGARTLASNSNEWRYIAVRRFFSFAEASIKKAVAAFMFAPNHARTWVQVKAMITGFLMEQWKNGALTGNTWEEAFQVSVGAGTAPDEMEISIGMAVARPAEFITVSFSQTMQQG